MRKLVYERNFRRDFRRLQRTGRNLDRFAVAVEALRQGEHLPEIYRDHQLTGNWRGFRECHLGGDLLLIYRMAEEELMLARIGSHSQLFD